MIVLGSIFSVRPLYAVEGVEVEIPIEVNGNESIEITAVEETAPLPLNTIIKVNETGSFIIPVNEYGNFHYTICQIPGTDEYTEYDTTVWNLEIMTINSSDGSKLEAVVVISKPGDEDKYDKVIFNNKVTPPTPTPSITPVPPTNPPVPPTNPPTNPPGQFVPNTGDNTNLGLYGSLFIGAIIVVGVLWKVKKSM